MFSKADILLPTIFRLSGEIVKLTACSLSFVLCRSSRAAACPVRAQVLLELLLPDCCMCSISIRVLNGTSFARKL